MWLIRTAMRRPITILMVILGVALTSILAIQRMRADIFPELGTPVIYVAQPYGGMDPAQMEGYLVNYYEYHFLYVRGIDYVESRSIQGAALMALHFHEGTDMAETVAQVNRSRAFMPPGTVPPFVMRFDAGSVPVGYLVFSSETRSANEISDLALFRVRPFVRGRARSLGTPSIRRHGAEPRRSRRSRAAARLQNVARRGRRRYREDEHHHSLGERADRRRQLHDAGELDGAPGGGAERRSDPIGAVCDRLSPRHGYAEDGADILTSYALVDGRRAVYIAVTKRADASTLDVVRRVRGALPTFRAAIPEDIDRCGPSAPCVQGR